MHLLCPFSNIKLGNLNLDFFCKFLGDVMCLTSLSLSCCCVAPGTLGGGTKRVKQRSLCGGPDLALGNHGDEVRNGSLGWRGIIFTRTIFMTKKKLETEHSQRRPKLIFSVLRR